MTANPSHSSTNSYSTMSFWAPRWRCEHWRVPIPECHLRVKCWTHARAMRNRNLSWDNFSSLPLLPSKSIEIQRGAWQTHVALIEFKCIVQLETLQESCPSFDRDALNNMNTWIWMHWANLQSMSSCIPILCCQMSRLCDAVRAVYRPKRRKPTAASNLAGCLSQQRKVKREFLHSEVKRKEEMTQLWSWHKNSQHNGSPARWCSLCLHDLIVHSPACWNKRRDRTVKASMKDAKQSHGTICGNSPTTKALQYNQ